MTRLTILEYPDPRLRTKATPVAEVDARLRQLVEDMLETMYAAKGVGLAATQVNVHKRLLVADVSEAKDTPLVFVNPEVLSREDQDLVEGPQVPATTRRRLILEEHGGERTAHVPLDVAGQHAEEEVRPDGAHQRGDDPE